MGKLLTIDEAAALLRVSRNTIYGQARAKLIPSIRIGRSWRFDEDVLHRLAGNDVVTSQPTVGSQECAIPQDVRDAIVKVAQWLLQTMEKHSGSIVGSSSPQPAPPVKRQLKPKTRPFLSGKDVARRLGISANTFHSLVKAGRFPRMPRNGRLYTEEMVDAYIEAGGVEPQDGWWPFILRRRFRMADEHRKQEMLDSGFDPTTGQFDTQV